MRKVLVLFAGWLQLSYILLHFKLFKLVQKDLGMCMTRYVRNFCFARIDMLVYESMIVLP